jgi:regulator of sigma E protease
MLAFLANAAAYVIPFLVLITIIVTVHEFGHFITARAFGVKVDRFSIGFGRTIAAFRDRWGVEWRIAWLPLGGYVRFAGDENASSVPDQDDLDSLRQRIVAREGLGAEKRYFFFKPLWQRALIVFAGPAINFLFSIVLFALVFATAGEPVAGSMKVSDVTQGSPAAAAGILPGDVVTSLNGRRYTSFDDLAAYVQDRPGTPMRLTLLRAGKTIDVSLISGVVNEKSPAGGFIQMGRLGLASPQSIRHENAAVALWRGTVMTWSTVKRTGDIVSRLVQGRMAWPFQGFLGTATITGTITKQAVTASQTDHVNLVLALTLPFVWLMAFLSTSIGLVNLLPIPVLDGGHLLFYGYEAVARQPLPIAAQAAGYRVGLALLVGLMLFTTWHDLQRLQVFHFLSAFFS